MQISMRTLFVDDFVRGRFHNNGIRSSIDVCNMLIIEASLQVTSFQRKLSFFDGGAIWTLELQFGGEDSFRGYGRVGEIQ